MLHDDIKKETLEALKSKDDVRLQTLRDIQTGITNKLVQIGKKPNETLEDKEVLSVIKKLSKQRKESIEQYKNAGREDAAESEAKELDILKEYLPKELSENEIRDAVSKKLESLSDEQKSNKGALIGIIMKDLSGSADGKVVSKIINELT